MRRGQQVEGAAVSWPRGGGVARAARRRGPGGGPWGGPLGGAQGAGGPDPPGSAPGSGQRTQRFLRPRCSLASPQVSPEDRRSLCRLSGNHRALGSGSGGPEKGCLGWCAWPGRGAEPGLSPQQPGNRRAAPRPSLALCWLGCWAGRLRAARAWARAWAWFGAAPASARQPFPLGPGRPRPCASTFPSGNGRVG